MTPPLGFDSSVLSAFARAKHLDTLQRLSDAHQRVVTRAVLDELARGSAEHPMLAEVGRLSWLAAVAVDSLDALVAFSHYVRALGSDSRNVGEASILAWAEVTPGIAVIDDQAAVTVAKATGLTVRRSLSLVAGGLNSKVLDPHEARARWSTIWPRPAALAYPATALASWRGPSGTAWSARDGVKRPP